MTKKWRECTKSSRDWGGARTAGDGAVGIDCGREGTSWIHIDLGDAIPAPGAGLGERRDIRELVDGATFVLADKVIRQHLTMLQVGCKLIAEVE